MTWNATQRQQALETRRINKAEKRLKAGERITEEERQLVENRLRSKMTENRKKNIDREWSFTFDVNWKTLPMEEAQRAYAELKAEFERAGTVLNARSMPTPGHYTCFICKKTRAGDPRGTDYSYINPETGLMQPILICGELCWLRYQEFRIGKRREAEMPRTA